MHDALNDREEAERIALAVGRAEWARGQTQRKMEQRAARLLTEYQPRRSTKHPRGATKATVASRKAKNRAKRKAR